MTPGTFSGGTAAKQQDDHLEVSDTGAGGWSWFKQALTHELTAADVGKYFRAYSLCFEDGLDSVNGASTAVGPVVAAMEVAAPTLTGDPCVGYTLSCSEPVVTGGSGTFQFDYFWVDETNVIVWEATKMAPTTIVTEYDLGKKMKCLVTVTDKGFQGGESITVESNQTIEAFRPTLGDYYTYVDNELIEQSTVGLTPSQICACLVQEDDPVVFPPKDTTFLWEIRSGTGRLSGDNGTPFIGYVAPDAAPAGALVTCSITSHHAQDVQSCQFEFLIAE